MRRLEFLVCAVIGGALILPGWSRADTIILDNEVLKLSGHDGYNYNAPALPSGTPQVTFAEFTEGGRRGVYLTLDLSGVTDPSPHDSYKYYVKDWLFNFNPSKSVADLDISWESQSGGGPASWDVSISKGENDFGLRRKINDPSDDWDKRSHLYDVTDGTQGDELAEDHLGAFDIMFSFQFPNQHSDPDNSSIWSYSDFDIGESVTFKIASSSYDVTAADFRFPSAGGTAMTAVGIWPSCENYEAWYTGKAPANVVPEPGTMVLVGTGLLGVGAWARRRTRRLQDDDAHSGSS